MRKKLEEILEKVYEAGLEWSNQDADDWDEALAKATTAILELMKGAVPGPIDPSNKSYSHDRVQMNQGWNNCRTEILKKIEEIEK